MPDQPDGLAHGRRLHAADDPEGRLETPVLLVIFNRPDTTKAVMESLRAARPSRLYVAADGPRAGILGEAERCELAREIATRPQWECSVVTRLHEHNLGLNRHVTGAIDWFFEAEEDGIILEDDCIPHLSFFRFCAELLEHHRESRQVLQISGNNFQYGRRRGSASYFYSAYPFIWGWATWRRAWSVYHFVEPEPGAQASSWDAQWLTTLDRNRGVSIIPGVNLVTNVGFGAGATHTITIERYSMLPVSPMVFPLVHPDKIVIDKDADRFVYYANFRNVRFLRLLWAYRAWDFVIRTLKRVKRRLMSKRIQTEDHHGSHG